MNILDQVTDEDKGILRAREREVAEFVPARDFARAGDSGPGITDDRPPSIAGHARRL